MTHPLDCSCYDCTRENYDALDAANRALCDLWECPEVGDAKPWDTTCGIICMSGFAPDGETWGWVASLMTHDPSEDEHPQVIKTFWGPNIKTACEEALGYVLIHMS